MNKVKNRLDFLKNNFIAHRGMHDINKKIPENSLKSFEEAINNNYTIELDLQMLKDGNVVVYHDNNLKRLTGVNKNIKDVIYDEIKKFKLQGTNMYIPLFKKVLDLIDGKVPVIIELKSNSKNRLLEQKTIDILKNYQGEYAIKSFNPRSVLWLKNNAPEVIRGQILSNYKHHKINYWKSIIFNKISKPDFISCDIRVLPNKRIEKLRKKLLVLGWTIRNKDDYKKAKNYCDNYICENINKLDL